MALNGIVKSIVTPTGKPTPTFGFITDDNGVDRFFLPAAISPDSSTQFRDLREGARVEFEPDMHERGARATKIKAIA